MPYKKSTVAFRCPECHREVEAPADWAGNQAECPACGKAVKVPESRPAVVQAIGLITCTAKIPERQPFEGKATQKQKQKLWDLGVRDIEAIDQLGKRQAGAAIDQIMGAGRQELARLRFKRNGIILAVIVGIILLFAAYIHFASK